MKNTIKRILLLLPVISVLLVALAVPAFAEATDGGYIEPVTFDSCLYDVDSAQGGQRSIDVTLGVPFSLDQGNTYALPCFLVIDVASLSGVSFDVPSGVFVIRYTLSGGSESSYIVSKLSSDGTSLEFKVHSTVSPIRATRDFRVSTTESLEILCSEDLLPYLTNVDYTYYTFESSSVDGFTSVWTEIMTWITSALTSVMGAFYVDGSLTLLGTLAVIGVSVGIGFLLIGIIQRFLKLRG